MDIENLNIDIDLLKFTNAGILSIQGRGDVKKCVVIPVEDNDIYVSQDDNGKAKAAYLHLTAWKNSEERYGQTHYVKQNLSQEYKDSHPNEDRKPILGNGSPAKTNSSNSARTVDAPFVQTNDAPEDLPF